MTVKLKLDWCSHKAAKYAVEHWHYSQCMPVGKLVKIGVWENNIFIGVVLFSRGANKNMLKPYGLRQIDGCELTRVALKEHISHVSRIISIALRLLKLKCKTMQLVVSYADTTQGHIGGIYQAGNWIYDFFSKTDQMLVNGKKIHKKSLYSKYGHSSAEKLRQMGFDVVIPKNGGKHRYLMPLNKAMRKKIELLSKPYPRGLTEDHQVPPVDGGASPTSTLQTQII